MLISSVVQFEIRPLDRVPGLTITRTSACAVLLTLKGGGSRGHVANVGIPIGSHACKPKRPDLAKPPHLKAPVFPGCHEGYSHTR